MKKQKTEKLKLVKVKPNRLLKTLGLHAKDDYYDRILKVFKCPTEDEFVFFQLRVTRASYDFVELDFKGLDICLKHKSRPKSSRKGDYCVEMSAEFLPKPRILYYQNCDVLLCEIVSTIESEIGLVKVQKEFDNFKRNCINIVPIDILAEPDNELLDSEFCQAVARTTKPRHCMYEPFEDIGQDLLDWPSTSDKFASDYDSDLDGSSDFDISEVDVDLHGPCTDMYLRYNYKFNNHSMGIKANTYPYNKLDDRILDEEDLKKLLPEGVSLKTNDPMGCHPDVFDPRLFLVDAFACTRHENIDYRFTLYVKIEDGGTIVEGRCCGLKSRMKTVKSITGV